MYVPLSLGTLPGILWEAKVAQYDESDSVPLRKETEEGIPLARAPQQEMI